MEEREKNKVDGSGKEINGDGRKIESEKEKVGEKDRREKTRWEREKVRKSRWGTKKGAENRQRRQVARTKKFKWHNVNLWPRNFHRNQCVCVCVYTATVYIPLQMHFYNCFLHCICFCYYFQCTQNNVTMLFMRPNGTDGHSYTHQTFASKPSTKAKSPKKYAESGQRH